MLQAGEHAGVPESVFLLHKPGHAAAGAEVFQVSGFAGLQGAADHGFLQRRHLLDLLSDSGIDFLPEPWHAAHQVRVDGVYRVGDDARVVVDGYGQAAAYAEVAPGLLQYVRHGEKRHRQVGVFYGVENLHVFLDCGVVVGMRYDHPFRLAGSARGVDQSRHVVGKSPLRTGFYLFCGLARGVHAEADKVVPEYRRGVIFVKYQAVVLEDDNLFDRWV